MPMYIFEHPKTGEQAEVFFGMNEEKKHIDEEGTEWKRVFVSSQLSTEGSIDPWDNADFVNKTGNKKGSYGDILDLSQELSDKRASQNNGVDPVKQKYFKDYSKQRGGKKHPAEMKKSFENKNLKIDFD